MLTENISKNTRTCFSEGSRVVHGQKEEEDETLSALLKTYSCLYSYNDGTARCYHAAVNPLDKLQSFTCQVCRDSTLRTLIAFIVTRWLFHINLERVFLIAAEICITHEVQYVGMVSRLLWRYKIKLHSSLLLQCQSFDRNQTTERKP